MGENGEWTEGGKVQVIHLSQVLKSSVWESGTIEKEKKEIVLFHESGTLVPIRANNHSFHIPC